MSEMVTPARLFKRADAALLKVYDPNQPRAPAGSAEGGQWTGGAGGGGGEGRGDYPYGTPAHKKKWEHLSKDEKDERMAELFLREASMASHGATPEQRDRAKVRLARWNELKNNCGALEQGMASRHEALRSNTAPGGASPTAATTTLSLHDRPPTPLRTKLASISSRAAALMRTLGAALDVVGSFHPDDESAVATTAKRGALVATALTTLATAVNIAARARDAQTASVAIKSAQTASSHLQTHLPQLVRESKNLTPEIKNKIKTKVDAANAKIKELDQVFGSSVGPALRQAQQAGYRTGFKLTGGKIITHAPAPLKITVAKPRRRY